MAESQILMDGLSMMRQLAESGGIANTILAASYTLSTILVSGDGVSAAIRRSPANCSARIRWRIDADWRSGQGLFELHLHA